MPLPRMGAAAVLQWCVLQAFVRLEDALVDAWHAFC